MRISKRVFILSLNILICAVVFYPKLAFAFSLTLSGDNWPTTGTLKLKAGATATSTTNQWTVTNDSGETEYIYIKVNGTNWSPGSASAANVFVLKYNTSGTWSSAITRDGIVLNTGLANGGTQQFSLQFQAPSSGTGDGAEGMAQTLTVTLTASAWTWTCGESFTVSHTTAGGVAPVEKLNVTYGTVLSSLGGTGDKCWITQNLGADHQATYQWDATDASAGWYWQFNRTQGYSCTGATRTPSAAWDTTNDNTACSPVVSGTEWCPEKDPCTLLLGTGWRLPTYTEWFNADANGVRVAPNTGTNWGNWHDAYGSDLKIHAAGLIEWNGTGCGGAIGGYGYYWSSTQYGSDPTTGYSLFFYDACYMDGSAKRRGLSVRCLRD